MKTLLVGECREGKLLESTHELYGFARELGAEAALFVVGAEAQLPPQGRLYLAEAAEYDPDLHKRLVLEAVEREGAECVVFLHSSYGWDLAPRVATALLAAQVSEVVAVVEGEFEVCCLNGKMRRRVRPTTAKTVVTIQAGSFPAVSSDDPLELMRLSARGRGKVEFLGYQPAETRSVDLARAEAIVSAGRGVGKKENLAAVAALANALGAELGASRPVVDAGWLPHDHQVGTTGQSVAPRLYLACGISGAIQHLAGMKKSDFVIAVNKDKEAPIGEIADVLVVADLMQFVPALTAQLQASGARRDS